MSKSFKKFSLIKTLEDTLGFGKYGMLTIREVCCRNPDYMDWVSCCTETQVSQEVLDFIEERKYIKLQQDLSNIIDPDLFEDVPF